MSEWRVADCVLCNLPEYLKSICKFRDYPFNEAKTEYLDKNGRCSKIKIRDLGKGKNAHES